MASGIRPTGSADFITLRELGNSSVFTPGKQATSDRESDNVSFVVCEDSGFTWSEDWQGSGLKRSTGPDSKQPAGIMSTCGPVVLELTSYGAVRACAWCTPPAHLARLNSIHRVSHTVCRPCLDRMLEAL